LANGLQYRLLSRGIVEHVVIDATGLKVFGEGEWKMRKYGKEKYRVENNECKCQ